MSIGRDGDNLLPREEFLKREKRYLEDYERFEQMLSEPAIKGIRINTLKFDINRRDELAFDLSPVPFCDSGFYVGQDGGLGKSPWHHAGAYYCQDPSAMAPVDALSPQPFERVLDMCAAPGGKTTQIAAAMKNTGLLVSNEVVRNRAQILISNIERLGVKNAAVTSLMPDVIADMLPEYFDRVLVDAPCSGEGMFRREEAAVREWSPEHVEACAVRQLKILESAARCLAPGGTLVYSTCTFSPQENELCVAAFLDKYPEFELLPIERQYGRAGRNLSDRFDLTLTRRIYPMDGGEGQFTALLKKSGDKRDIYDTAGEKADLPKELSQLFVNQPDGIYKEIGDLCYILPSMLPPDLPVIRAGVLAGEIKKNRITPAHALFMSGRPDDFTRCVELSQQSAQLEAFLRGEQLDISGELGFTAVACGGVITGFGKQTTDGFKNHYPKGLRNR